MFGRKSRDKPSSARGSIARAMGGDPGLVPYGSTATPAGHDTDALDDRDRHEAELLLAEMKGLAAAAASTSERFTAQARQAFAYIAGFFTIAQAAEVAALGQTTLSHAHKLEVLGLAIAAGVGMVTTGILAITVEKVRQVSGVGSKDLLKAASIADEQGFSIEGVITKFFSMEVDAREASLITKRDWLRLTHWAAGLTIVVVGIELVVALAVRL